MSSNFSFPRLIQLVKRQWYENSRLYLFSVLALLGIEALVFWTWAFTGGPDYNEEILFLFFITGLYVFGFIFASFSFHQLSDKTKGTYWLGLPASHLEKLICIIFYSTVVFIVIYCASFFLVKSIAMAYIRDLVATDGATYKLKYANLRTGFGEVFWIFMYGFIAIQAFYLLGSVYFARYAFVLTTIVGAALIIFFMFYSVEVVRTFFGKQYAFMITSVKEADADPRFYRSYELSSFASTLCMFIFKYTWAPVFWLATWYRLKEKQV